MKTIRWSSVINHRTKPQPTKEVHTSELSYAERHQVRQRPENPESAEDNIARMIEEGSFCNEGFGREKGRTSLIDVEILARFLDPEDIKHEDTFWRHPDKMFQTNPGRLAEDVSDEDYDFRDHLDDAECNCEKGETCIRCCTQPDFDALPFPLSRKSKVNVRQHKIYGQVFDIVILAEVAEVA